MKNIKATVIRSNRKTLAIQLDTNLKIIVRAPIKATQNDIEKVLKEKEEWIKKHTELIKKKKAQYIKIAKPPISKADIQKLAEKALKCIPKRVAYFANIIGVSYGNITIRNQKTRWGSCSGKGNLNFNCLIMLAPSEIIDYIVVHELCHRKEMNHSKEFWSEIEKVLPNYKKQIDWLKKEGNQIIKRQKCSFKINISSKTL